MATQTNSPYAAKQREPKFLLSSLFVDADVPVEPAEPQKIVVAGMAEANIKKEYPEGFFKKAIAVFQGEYVKMLKTTAWFLASTLLFILVLTVAARYFENHIIGDGYNFMSSIGVGYPGGGDSISESVANLYWNVYQPVLMMLAGAMIIASAFASGQFYSAKRSFYQDSYKKCIRTYFYGFAKHWWKYLVTGTVGTLLMLAMGTALLNVLSKQQLGTVGAGDYCGVVFAFVFGAPMLTVPMVMMSLFTTYKLSFKDTFKDALVLIVNNPLTVLIVGVLSLAPLLICVAGTVVAIIAYIAMLLAGFNFLALSWVAMADRGMKRCKALKAYNDKKVQYEAKRSGQKAAYAGNPTQKKQTAKKPNQPYQNPKKKKKK